MHHIYGSHFISIDSAALNLDQMMVMIIFFFFLGNANSLEFSWTYVVSGWLFFVMLMTIDDDYLDLLIY